MKTTLMKTVVLTAFALLSLSFPTGVAARKNFDPAVDAFWGKFQSAVARNDKDAVASMTKFPLGMPYGVRSIKTKAQLLKSYGKIFDAETKKCFAAARPEIENARDKKFSISCGEAMMYWFEMFKGQYKFAAVDNVNE